MGLLISVNGKKMEFAENVTLAELLKQMKVDPKLVACEINTKIIRKKEYETTAIATGDRIEILQMIGGG